MRYNLNRVEEKGELMSRDLSRRQVLFGSLGIFVGIGAMSARNSQAGPVTIDRFGDQNQTLPRRELPEFAKSRGPNVSGNYRYAAEQGKNLEYIPCYCGCGGIDHRNNRDCYIKSENRDGTLTYTSHAAT